MKFKLNCGLIGAFCLLASIGWADSLELRNGSLIRGKFVGGTETEISFQVGSSTQKYNVADVVSIKFDSESQGNDSLRRRSSLSGETEAPRRTSLMPLRYVTIPAGTRISVRMIDGVDSTQNRAGDRFQASLQEPLTTDGNVVVPKGSDVYGRLAESKESGKFAGRSQLQLN